MSDQMSEDRIAIAALSKYQLEPEVVEDQIAVAVSRLESSGLDFEIPMEEWDRLVARLCEEIAR